MSDSFEPLARRIQAQSRDSAEENIAPLLNESHPLHENIADAGDAEWLLFNLLSLGNPACVSPVGPD